MGITGGNPGFIGGGGSVTAEAVAEVLGDALAGEGVADGVREILELIITPSLASATGWTTTNGSGTASITSNVARLQLGSGVTTALWANHAKVTRAHGLNPFASSLRCRVAAWTGGDSGNVYLALGMRAGTSSNEGLFANIRGNGGALTLYAESVSGGGSLGSSSPSRSDLAGGQFWVRLDLTPHGPALFTGVGSGGAEPPRWNVVGSSTSTAGWRSDWLETITLSLGAGGGGSPDNVTVDLDNITVRGLW